MLSTNDTRLSTKTSNVERNKQKPLIFHLPDGDIVEIYPMEGINYRLELDLHPVLDQLDLITNLLKRINSRIRHWHSVYGTEGEWGIVDQNRTISASDRLPFTHLPGNETVSYSDTITSQSLYDFWRRENERVPLARKDWSNGTEAICDLLDSYHENHIGIK